MKTLNFFPWNLPKEYEKPKSQLLSVVDDTTLTFVATSDIPGLQIAESKLPDGTAGEAYKTKLTASGGNHHMCGVCRKDLNYQGNSRSQSLLEN